MKGVFFTDKTGLKIFVFINALIFAFITFVTNTPLWGKNASKAGVDTINVVLIATHQHGPSSEHH